MIEALRIAKEHKEEIWRLIKEYDSMFEAIARLCYLKGYCRKMDFETAYHFVLEIRSAYLFICR